ncbi:MAG: glycosyltransferase family 4 protein, partial [Rhodothermales bacterium]
QLARHLAQAGARVDVYHVLPHDAGADGKSDVFAGEHLPNIRLIPVERARPDRFPGHYVWESYRSSVAVWEALKSRLDVDFIYAQGFAGWETIRRKRMGAPVPPIGVNFHGFEMWQRPASARSRLEQWLLRPFVKWNVRHADATLLLGRSLESVFARMGVVPRHLVESPNGVTPEWLTPDAGRPEGPTRFVFIGRYERRKGIEELQEVIARMPASADYHFDFIGPIPDALRLDSPRVTYHGLLREEGVIRDILKRADILVCPSYAEGMPTVILEAMASGLAVIATDVGAVADLVSRDNGWIIPTGDVEALRDAVLDAIASRPAIASKRRASQERIRAAYLWNTVASDTLRRIEATLS